MKVVYLRGGHCVDPESIGVVYRHLRLYGHDQLLVLL